MLLDAVIIVVLLILVINGSKRGLLLSWKSLVSLIVATLLVQHYYLDFSSWIASKLAVNPQIAVAIGYLLLWCSSSALMEMLLASFIRESTQYSPSLFDRICGGLYGFMKAIVIVLLPLIVTSVPIKMDSSQKITTTQTPLSELSVKGSYLVTALKPVSKYFLPLVGPYVVSAKTK